MARAERAAAAAEKAGSKVGTPELPLGRAPYLSLL